MEAATAARAFSGTLALTGRQVAGMVLNLVGVVAATRLLGPGRYGQFEFVTRIAAGEVIEDYLDDPRGHSCLLLGRGTDHRAIHVVCAPKSEYLAIIAAYLSSPDEWDEGCRVRRQS